jgi:16S rRNA (adenine1518-N6/adenine1519-N6)-dimethyltransferase
VESAIVKMMVNRHRYVDTIRDYRGFQDVVRAIYDSRRKTISNSLLSLCASHGIKKNETRDDLAAILERVGIRPDSRGEELEIEKLIELSNEISDYVSLQKNE